jgi:hypothetical protein
MPVYHNLNLGFIEASATPPGDSGNITIDIEVFPPVVAESGEIFIDGHKSQVVSPGHVGISSLSIEVSGHKTNISIDPDKIVSSSVNVKALPLEAFVNINHAGCEADSPVSILPITIETVNPSGVELFSHAISITANNTIITVNSDKVLAATSATDAFSISRPNVTEGIIVLVSPEMVKISSPYPPVPIYDNYPEGDAPGTFGEAFDIGVFGPGADYNYSQMLGGNEDDHDWYKFTIPEGRTVCIEVTFDFDGAYFGLELWDAGESYITGSYENPGIERIEEDLQQGTYYIHIFPLYSDTIATKYQLSIHVSGSFPVPDGSEAITVFVGDIFNGQPGIIHHKILGNFNGLWLNAPAVILNHGLLPAFNEFKIPETVPYSVIYNCILTGAQNGVEDLILPLKNFQTRLRDGEPTYCGIVVPDVGKYLGDIVDRKNGEIVIQKGVYYNSGEKNFVELVRVDLEEIGYDRGTKNNSISLSGHKTTQNTSPKTVELKKIQTESLQKNGSHRIRSDVDFFTRPGDTVIWHGKSMVAGMITITVGKNISTMDITEL